MRIYNDEECIEPMRKMEIARPSEKKNHMSGSFKFLGISMQISLLILAGLLTSFPAPVSATEFNPLGGEGGNPFRAECPRGSYLIGLNGNTGTWVDRIHPICARWLPNKRVFDAPSIGTPHGTSDGGNPSDQRCPIGFAVVRWNLFGTRGTVLVQYLKVYCAAVETPTALQTFLFGSIPGKRGSFDISPFTIADDQACPDGELATGFKGRAGLFLDAVGLICGPAPKKLGTSPPSQAGNMTSRDQPGKPRGPIGTAEPNLQAKHVQPYPKILSPLVGQRFFAQSTVPIKLGPPTGAAATNYEVAIQRKDTTGNWIEQHRFPIGATEAQSPGGYQGFGAGGKGPTKSPVLLTTPGPWRLQARVLQPTPMAWSDWLGFLVEPPLTKGAILQTPSQGIGAGPGLIPPNTTGPGQLMRPDTGSVSSKQGSTVNPLLKKQSPQSDFSIQQTPKKGMSEEPQIFLPQPRPSRGVGGTELLRSRGIEENESKDSAPDAEKKP